MNSKITLLLSLLFVFAGCGVKAPPQKYPDTIIESYVQTYTKEKEPEINEEADKIPPKAPQN